MVKAGRVREIPPGTSKVVRAAGRSILLANWDGQIFASVPVCPHQSHPLAGATVRDCQLECPWHHFRYDLRTGENVYPRNVYPLGAPDIDQERLQADLHSLRMYAVEVRDGNIYVEL